MRLAGVAKTQDLFRVGPCPVCGGWDWRRLYPVDLAYAALHSGLSLKGLQVGVAGCRGCGHQFIQPVPQAAFLRAFYASYVSAAQEGFYREQTAAGIPEGFRRRYEPWLEQLVRLAPGRRLLDVGAGLGMFARLAGEWGFEVSAVEPNPEAARRLREPLGFPVHECLLEELETGERYDAVTMWDLLEHLADPGLALRRVHRLLRPGGLLALETPVRDCLVSRLARGLHTVSWGRIERPLFLVCGLHHLQYFSERHLKEFVGERGFEVVRAQRQETNLASLLRETCGLKWRAYNAALSAAFLAARRLGSCNKLVIIARRSEGRPTTGG